MSDPTYYSKVRYRPRKVLRWLHGEVITPPFSVEARRHVGLLLRELQEGQVVAMPDSRPMPSIGPRVSELRVRDLGIAWRIIYRIDPDAILISAVFAKKSQQTPQLVVETCQMRFRQYDRAAREGKYEEEQ